MRKILTNKQEEVFNIVKEFIEKNGYSPSIRELCALTNKKSTSTISDYLMILKDKGYITYQIGKNRTIRIIDEVK